MVFTLEVAVACMSRFVDQFVLLFDASKPRILPSSEPRNGIRNTSALRSISFLVVFVQKRKEKNRAPQRPHSRLPCRNQQARQCAAQELAGQTRTCGWLGEVEDPALSGRVRSRCHAAAAVVRGVAWRGPAALTSERFRVALHGACYAQWQARPPLLGTGCRAWLLLASRLPAGCGLNGTRKMIELVAGKCGP